MSRSRDRAASYALVIFAVALAVRLLHLWQMRGSLYFSLLLGDARGYDEWAQRLAAGEWIGRDVFYQAPLYPYVLGAIYAVAGHSLPAVRVVQAVVGSASCALLGLAVTRLVSRAAGVAAGLMLALYAPAVFFDGLIQKSVLDVFFVCLALWLISGIATERNAAFAERKNATSSSWFFLGLALGGLSLTRENALVFVVVIAMWTLIPTVSRRSQRSLRFFFFFLFGLALVLVPVAARNAMVGGGFYLTTSQFGPNFYIGNHAGADGSYDSLRAGRGAPEFERQDATDLAEHALGRRLTPAEVSGYWTDRALGFITDQPGAWVRLMARKVALLWNASEMVDTESQESHAEGSWPLKLLGPVGHFGVLVPLAFLGLVVTWRDRSRLLVLYALIAAYAASVALFYVFGRYRYPLVPLLLVFASAGVVELPSIARRRRFPGSMATLAALVIIIVFTNWPIVSASTMRAVTETNLGAALQADKRVDEALAHYQRAVALREDYAPAYNNLATALREKGRPAEAVATYQRALSLHADFPDAHYNLANALLDLGRVDEAIEHFQIALRSIPGSVETHTNLAGALAAKERFDEAIAELRTAIGLDPNAVQAEHNLGSLLGSLGRSDEAIAHLKHAAQIAPADASVRYDLAVTLLEARQFDAAISEFRETLRLTPNAIEARNNLGIALASQGKLDDAIDQFQQALKIQPGFADAQKNLAMATDARRRKTP